MATKIDENVFASPWNDSDLVLVVEDQELHVHRSILTLLSPVFKAMLDGHFKEASEDKITLEGKDFKSMVLFLKVLYPPSMFEESKPPLNDVTRLSVMALAEEYQCVNLITQCINEAEITPENVLQILPYVVKYHQTALPRMYDVINWSAPTSKLEEVSPTLENKEILNKMLFTKCRFLESSIVEMQNSMFLLLFHCLMEKKKADDAYQSILKIQTENLKVRYDRSLYQGRLTESVRNSLLNTASDIRCAHVVHYNDINKIAGCPHCKEKYKKKFLAPIHSFSNRTQYYLDILQRGNDIATAVKKTSKQRFVRTNK